MDTLFPFGLPFATAFYLTIYLATLMIHIVFMNYVLAGSAYMACDSVIRGDGKPTSPIAALLKDWMPFMLSAAITAGIAPLLFLQILYKQQFYTANLLLFYRWMAILPVMIVGFYLAYLLKSKLVSKWPLAARAFVGCGAFACFAFIGWSWVENHLLSVQSQEVWAQQFASDSLIYRTRELVPRLSLWFIAAFPTMALIIGWQLWQKDKKRQLEESDSKQQSLDLLPGSRRTSAIALAGLLLSMVSAGLYYSVMQESARKTIMGPVAFPYLILSVSGAVVQSIAWIIQFRNARLDRRWLWVATVGLVVNFVGTAVVNEATRLATFDIEALADLATRHKKAFEVGGLFAFILFFILNVVLIGFCVRLVGRASSHRSDPDEATDQD